jgi:hypothetical protein
MILESQSFFKQNPNRTPHKHPFLAKSPILVRMDRFKLTFLI